MTLALVAALALGVVGCGEEVAEKVAEKAVEKAVESESGEDVDIDYEAGSDSDQGTMSIKSGDDSAEIGFGEGGELPDGFPEVDLPEGSLLIGSSKVESGDRGAAYTANFLTELALGEAYSHFVESLPGNGYELAQQIEMSGAQAGYSIVASNDEFELTVFGSAEEGEAGSSFVIAAEPLSE